MKHNDPAGIGNAMSFGSTPLSAKTLRQARSFLHLVDTHFPAGHKLHKIFNRNTVKVIITSHNTRIIRKSQTQVTSVDNCNCRNNEACPLQNKCMNKDIVYKACQHKNRFQVKSLNKERNACYFNDNTPTFPP